MRGLLNKHVGSAFRRIGRSRLVLFLGILGPGVIAANAGNDAGGITTWSVIGSRYGYGLLWLLAIVTPLLAIAQEMNARIGVVTGRGLAALIRERFSLRITAFAILATMIANFGTAVSEFSGIAAASELFHTPTWVGVPVVAVAVWLLVTHGSYRKVERVFLALGLVYLTYIVSGIIAEPDWRDVGRGLAPQMHASQLWLLTVIAAVGTTITPWGQFFIQASVTDKHVSLKEFPYTRAEVFLGSTFMAIIDFFIVVACAETLFKHGIVVETAEDAARALGPLLGAAAKYLFALGLLNVSILASGILPLATAYVVCEAFGFEAGLDRSFSEAPIFNGLLTAFIFLPALVAMIPGLPLVRVILVAQTVNGMLLPIVLIFVLLIINDRRLMGDHVNGRTYNWIAWTFSVVLIALSAALVLTALPLPFL
jgi:Mn2+/Fe2+ NRAMP family transporter